MITNGTSGEWNFGPTLEQKHTVADLVQCFAHSWGVENAGQNWKLEETAQPHEAAYLLLNSDKSRESLSWNDKLDFITSIDLTAKWFKETLTENSREVTVNQIKEFLTLN